ncbi:MAG: ribosome assembly cofactor RimP [Parvicellaceae bacterium]
MVSKEKVIALAQERIKELDNGNYLVKVSISSKNVINVKMDNINGGVSIKDCVSVSRNIEHNLDRESEDFELQVSSPGLDQPFFVKQQYQKNIGKKVNVITTEDKLISGELISSENDEIILKEVNTVKNTSTKKKEIIENIHLLKMKNIKETKLIISF